MKLFFLFQPPETSKDASAWPSLNAMSSKDTSPSTTSTTAANTIKSTTNTSNKVKVSKSESVVSSGQEVNGEISNESNQDVKENKNDSNVSSSKKKKGNFYRFIFDNKGRNSRGIGFRLIYHMIVDGDEAKDFEIHKRAQELLSR